MYADPFGATCHFPWLIGYSSLAERWLSRRCLGSVVAMRRSIPGRRSLLQKSALRR